jgi:protein disulfide-isomerase A6
MRLSSIFLSLIPLVSLVSAAGSKVVDLDSSNFDSLIGQDKPALVEFYAPWVSLCLGVCSGRNDGG